MQLMDSRLSIALWIVFCVLSSQVIYNVGQEIISENPCPEPPPTPMSASMDFVFVSSNFFLFRLKWNDCKLIILHY